MSSNKLHSILKVSRHKELESARMIGQAQASLQVSQETLEALLMHKESYHSTDKQCNAQSLLRERSFMSRLDQAINLEKSRILQLENDLEAKLELWRTAHSRHQSLSKAHEKIERSDAVKRQKNEQAESDEMANVLRLNRFA
ncbi:MAG: flagellar export protein FliJ [bacterium]